MTPREKRLQRKKWNENNRRYLEKKKKERVIQQMLIDNSPPTSDREENVDADQDPLEGPSHQSVEVSNINCKRCQKKDKLIRRLRYSYKKEIGELKQEKEKVIKEKDAMRKMLMRQINKQRKIQAKPSTGEKVDNLIKSIDEDKREEVKKKILFGEIISNNLRDGFKVLRKKEKREFSDIVMRDKDRFKKHKVLVAVKDQEKEQNNPDGITESDSARKVLKKDRKAKKKFFYHSDAGLDHTKSVPSVLHLIPQEFETDRNVFDSDGIGMSPKKQEMELDDSVTTQEFVLTSVANIETTAKKQDLQLDDSINTQELVLTPTVSNTEITAENMTTPITSKINFLHQKKSVMKRKLPFNDDNKPKQLLPTFNMKPRPKKPNKGNSEKVTHKHYSEENMQNALKEVEKVRHPSLVFRTPEAVTAASSTVSEADVRGWFQQIKDYFVESNLFDIQQHVQWQ
ncbi:unnamed protein product [Arctia plantaginis]|uniref:Uncharacterized protein n=1 Tax=Arctia plantaginis TaxID=874455 RepID=A0A8S0ZNE0_ARCPL|nr:unnamed protein product [Arctia plantaginis]